MEGIMKIEDIKIEDAADANYVIKKYFNNDLKNMKMTQLEQLVLTVYEMGKKNGVATDSAPDETETETETKSADKEPAKEKHFKLYEKVKVLEDIEIGRSGEFIKTNDIGTLILMKGGDAGTILFEAGEDGEMLEVDISFDKLDKAE
jgi:hypothetical protein